MKPPLYLIMTVGKTHSGKTTFARKLHEQLPGFCLIDTDEVMPFLRKQVPEILAYEKSLGHTLDTTKLRSSIGKLMMETAFSYGLSLIVPNGHITRNVRNQKRELAQKYKAKVIYVSFELPTEVLAERIRTTVRSTDPLNLSNSYEELLERQQKIFEEPSDEEADYFFVIKQASDCDQVMEQVLGIIKGSKALAQ